MLTSSKPAPQTFDALMSERGFSSADLVKASTAQLTFKMVQKARKGKRLTPNVKKKILAALRCLDPQSSFVFPDA
ncbi:MAG: hypothetical protein WCG06_01065 [Candidatus Omnitrophota bacterium]